MQGKVRWWREEVTMAQLVVWDNFYVIVGTAAATLTGLMFVVVTLINRSPRLQRAGETFGAFNTPSVVHFSAALGIAAMLTAPWQVLWQPVVLLGIAGLGGLSYMRLVVRRAQRQTAYSPVLEDWIWHSLFPIAGYSALVVAALVGAARITPALFIAGAATVLFLFIGIHNAWDNVTYPLLAFSSTEQNDPEDQHRRDADERSTPG
jgi:hypothetical protein